ncbi:hypothetical protein [Maribacter sp. ACAM166]|uniref:hypothetical protein n=1 Tax=Maribacter sp. ACAM166 TaxID=2508996 RepID=UPI0010FF3E4A|nr:hypothetical protein [Maribacter sp. ACAM166]TLP81379.1 hypothetical protein ES765_05060 [Maribacter sp. ACAM166]
MAQPIKVQLNLEKLKAINHELSQTSFEPAQNRWQNVERAVLHQVAKTLAKKQINIYPVNKPFKLKLQYYEADALEVFLRLIIEATSIQENYLLRSVADEINQKLA